MKKAVIRLFISFIIAVSVFIPTEQNSSYAQNYQIDEQINIRVYESVLPSVVVIDADLSDGVSSGTGVIVDSKGLILTSSHVVEGSDQIKIIINNGKEYQGKVIAVMEEGNDLALIKINTDKPLNTIKFGDSSKVKVGQKVLAIGNPFGFNETLTTGIVSRIDSERNKIQTDAAINPGCSGGPILNTNGELIGISQSIYNPDNNRSNIGIGFAVPVNSVKQFLTVVKTIEHINR